MTILVLAEKNSTLVELCRSTRQQGYRVGALVVGYKIQQLGFANIVWFIPAKGGARVEDFTEEIVTLVEKEKPRIILIEPTIRCKLLAENLAVILGASIITNVSELTENKRHRVLYMLHRPVNC